MMARSHARCLSLIVGLGAADPSQDMDAIRFIALDEAIEIVQKGHVTQRISDRSNTAEIVTLRDGEQRKSYVVLRPLGDCLYIQV